MRTVIIKTFHGAAPEPEYTFYVTARFYSYFSQQSNDKYYYDVESIFGLWNSSMVRIIILDRPIASCLNYY